MQKENVLTVSDDDDVSQLDHSVSYSIKVVNPAKKSDYHIYTIRDSVEFRTVKSLEKFIKANFKEFKEADAMCIGYVEPGHGWKGKQQWINTDEDLGELYAVYKAKKNLMLWCHLPKKKPKPSGEPASKRSKIEKENSIKTSEANEVFEALKEKHSGKYKPEHLHAWAQLVQMKKHKSLDDPPDYPYFKGRSKRQAPSSNGDKENIKSPPRSSVISPGMKVHMRTECIEQLQKIGDLRDKGIISEAQHTILQEAIMKDIL